jgi:carbamoyl-phosphate synthase large subunit
MRRMLGVRAPVQNRNLQMDYVAAKVPMFSFSRLVGADPMLGVEMASTGEVGCFGDDGQEALLHALLATGFRFPKKGVLLSLGPITEKYSFVDEARVIHEVLNLPIYATEGTAEVLKKFGIPCVVLAKQPTGTEPPVADRSERNSLAPEGASALDVIETGRVDLVINVPREYDQYGRPDGYLIRRRAVDSGIPLITDLQLARAVIEALRRRRDEKAMRVLAWDEYLGRRASTLQ